LRSISSVLRASYLEARLLILMFLLSPWMCYAQDEKAVSVKSPSAADASESAGPASGEQSTTTAHSGTTTPREGETIWLEQKIAPPTRWIESLVKPLTTWMERKVQHPGTHTEETRLAPWVRPEAPPTTDGNAPEAPTLSPTEAAAVARQAFQGEVLRVKLISAHSYVPIYRVKLISKRGEIQILHINAHNGELVPPANPAVSNPSD
jgi:hypothetical protein